MRNLHAYLVHHTSSAAVSVPCFSPFFLSHFLPADLVYLSNRRLSTDFFPSPSYFLLPIVPFILFFFPPPILLYQPFDSFLFNAVFETVARKWESNKISPMENIRKWMNLDRSRSSVSLVIKRYERVCSRICREGKESGSSETERRRKETR